MVRTMLVIAAKDLRQRARDRSAYLMGIVGPLALVVILNGTLGSVDDSGGFHFGVVDADGGELAASFISVLEGIEDDGAATIIPFADRSALAEAVADGEVAAGFVVPAGFSDQARAGGSPEIVIVGDPGSFPCSTSVVPISEKSLSKGTMKTTRPSRFWRI